MTAFDFVLLIVLAASVIVGLFRGLVKEVLSLLAWIVAFVVASRYGTGMAGLMPDAISAPALRAVAGFALLFIGTLILGALVNTAIAHIITASGLKGIDRGLGGLFGLGRGALIVLTLVFLAGMTDLPRQPVWRDALLSGAAETAVGIIKPWLPDSWARRVDF